jgi:hypothetical protein
MPAVVIESVEVCGYWPKPTSTAQLAPLQFWIPCPIVKHAPA